MYGRGGVRLTLSFFLECHLFDLWRGTDTHTVLPNTKYVYAPDTFSHGSGYMGTWRSELLNSFHVVKAFLGDSFRKYAFVDVGCGKGKALLVWKEELDKLKIESVVAGIEYYDPLAEIARRNYQKLFANGNYIYTDEATKFNYRQFGDRLIIHIFNPFDDLILRKFLAGLAGLNTIIIYLNPVHKDVILEFGYDVIYEKRGWNLATWTVIFASKYLQP